MQLLTNVLPRRRLASYRTLALLAGLGVAAGGPAWAQSPTTQSSQQGYWLRVTADKLNVRSRPDGNSLIVTRVPQNTVLWAAGSEFGWHKVAPPAGCFALASAQYIQRTGDDTGVVNVQTRLRVRFGSTVREIDPLRSEVQTWLENGQRVRILGEYNDDWLKVAPPEDAYVYVSGDHVDRISSAVAERLRAKRGTTTQPAEVSAATTRAAATTQPAVATTQPTENPYLRGAWGQRLLVVEADIKTEGERDPLERDWPPLIERLEPIAEQIAEPVAARIARAWIVDLQKRVTFQEAARIANELRAEGERERVQYAKELERIERLRKLAATRPAFVARGLLLESDTIDQRQGQHWYKLQNPFTNRIEAYLVMDPEAGIDAAPLIGKYVGVRGVRRFAGDVGADVVMANEVVVLRRELSKPRPTRREP